MSWRRGRRGQRRHFRDGGAGPAACGTSHWLRSSAHRLSCGAPWWARVAPLEDGSARPSPDTGSSVAPFGAVARSQGAAPQPLGRSGAVSRAGGCSAVAPYTGRRYWSSQSAPQPSPGCGRQSPPALGADQPHGARSPDTPSMPGVWVPPPCRRQESGPVRGLCQVLFILFPQKHLVRGQLLGGSHDTAAGAARYGTVRHGTGSLRVAQSTADTHTVTMFGGSAPGIALTAGNGARPRSALRLCALRPRPALPQFGLGARPHKVGYTPPVPAGTEARWRMRARPQRGSRSRLRFTHCTSIYSARSGGGRGPGGGTRGLCTCHPWGEAAGVRGPGLSAVGLPHGSTTLPPTLPALGTGRAPCEGPATERGLPAATGSSITSAQICKELSVQRWTDGKEKKKSPGKEQQALKGGWNRAEKLQAMLYDGTDGHGR